MQWTYDSHRNQPPHQQRSRVAPPTWHHKRPSAFYFGQGRVHRKVRGHRYIESHYPAPSDLELVCSCHFCGKYRSVRGFPHQDQRSPEQRFSFCPDVPDKTCLDGHKNQKVLVYIPYNLCRGFQPFLCKCLGRDIPLEVACLASYFRP